MFLRNLMLIGVTFLFIFGWKVTPVFDLVLASSIWLAFWVFVLSDARLHRAELLLAAYLIALSVYSMAVTVAFGAADAQVALRSIRAFINFLGGVALVFIYRDAYGNRALPHIALSIYACITMHGILICCMFALPSLRAAIYALASTYEYVNLNAPLLLGLRIPGLTYGLASTSVVQLCGLLLLPCVLRDFGRCASARILIWASVLPLIVSIFLTGRTGLLLAAGFLPILLLMSRGRERKMTVADVLRSVSPFVFVLLGVAIIAVRHSETITTTFAYTLEHAGEILELLESGHTASTDRISSMFFLPEDPATLLLGSSNSGRGDLGYIPSDVGYIKLIFSIGLVGLILNLAPYLVGFLLALQCYIRTSAKTFALATGFCLIAGVLLNFKELALLTRNQWSIQSVLVAACALYLRQLSQERLSAAAHKRA